MGLRDFTLSDIIERNARLHPGRLAFALGDERITHAAYRVRAGRLAAALADAGIRPGDRLGVVSQNNLEFVDLYGAAARLGAILVPINWRLSADEVAYVLADAALKIVIADAANMPLLQTRTARLADGRALVRDRRRVPAHSRLLPACSPAPAQAPCRRPACRCGRRARHDPYGGGRRVAARRAALAYQPDRGERSALALSGR